MNNEKVNKVNKSTEVDELSNDYPFSIVHKPIGRVDAVGKVTGKMIYAADFQFDNTTFASPVYSQYSHALIKNIDVSGALKVKGVITVLTAKDVPGSNLFGTEIKNQQIFARDKVRYYGDVVAMVIAETENIAREASEKVKVKYEPLDAVFNVREAMKKDAPKIHDDGNVAFEHRVRKGDIQEGFREADIVLEREYKTQFVEHLYIEPESVSAKADWKGGVEIYGSIQNIFSARKTVSSALNIPLNRVRIVQTPLGGSFGGKDEIMQALAARAAIAAIKTNRPCKIVYRREESIRESYKRHPYIIKYKIGAKKNGKLVALKVEIFADVGAYEATSPFVTWRSTVQCAGPYEIPNVHADVYGVYTNNTYTGAMRGFGSPQVNFAIESLIDELAEKLNISPLEIRIKNGYKDGSITTTGQVLDHKVSLMECLDKATRAINYHSKKREYMKFNKKSKVIKKGIGLACSYRGCSLGAEGKDYAGAILSIQSDGSVILSSGIAENGSGAQTVLSQIAAEVLGISMNRIRFLETDTSTTVDSGPTVASRGTLMGGNAVKKAAEYAKNTILNVASKILETSPDNLYLKDEKVISKTDSQIFITLDNVIEKCVKHNVQLCFFGWYTAPEVDWDKERGQGKAYFTYVYGCNIAEVEVDTETGKVKVTNFVSTHDVGRTINPQTAQGQIYGGVAMGLGYALLEEVEMNNGKIVNDNLDEYLIATAMDMPEITPIFVENPDIAGPFGAKSLGEPATEIVAPAIINAICNAIGRRIYELPANLEEVLLGKKLRKK